MKRNNIIKYIAISIIIIILSSVFHEFAHWITYKLMGYNANLTINTVNLTDTGLNLSRTEKLLTSGAGPLFTIFQAMFVYFILMKRENIYLYPILFYPLVYRFGGGIANFFQANDEGRISLALHLNIYTLSIIVVGFLLFLVVKISKKYNYSFLFNLLNFLLSFMMMILISYLDTKFNLQII